MEVMTISFIIFAILSCLMALAFTIICVGPLINYLKQKTIGQYIREDGPQEHQSKKGTPTMGGIAILFSILFSSSFILFVSKSFSTEAILFLISITCFSLIGFADDYLKVIKKHNKGVTGWTKLLGQLTIAGAIVCYMFFFCKNSSISIFGLTEINLGWFYILFGLFIIVGSSNAVNLTDGLDGLASLTSSIAFFTLGFFLYKTGNNPLAIIAIAIGGSCLGFMVYNRHPAQIFMGDVGSLMLGGAFGALGVLGGLELWLAPIGIIFVVEVLSVIIQVISFKTTGKRVFKMTPLHHHFELSGDKETTVVLKFFSAQGLCCILSVVAGYIWLF